MDIIINPTGPTAPSQPTGPLPMHPEDNPTTPYQTVDPQRLLAVAAQTDSTLTTALQTILDYLAEAVVQRGTDQKATLNTLTTYIRGLARTADATQNNALNTVLTDLNHVIQSNAAFNQTIADTIVQELATAATASANQASASASSASGNAGFSATVQPAIPGQAGSSFQSPSPAAGGWLAAVTLKTCIYATGFTTSPNPGLYNGVQYLGPFATEADAQAAAKALIATLSCGGPAPSGPTTPTGPTAPTGPTPIFDTLPNPTLFTGPSGPTPPILPVPMPTGDGGLGGQGGGRDRPGGGKDCPPPVVNCPAPIINVMPCQPGQPGGPIPTGPTLPTGPTGPGDGGGGGAPRPIPDNVFGVLWPGPGKPVQAKEVPIGQGCMHVASIARIGSPDWCEAILDTVGKMRAIGDLLLNILKVGAPSFYDVPLDGGKWFRETVGQLPFGVGAAATALWSAGASTWNFLTAQVKETVNCSLAIVRAVTCSDPALVISLTVLRSVIQAFHNFRVGPDAGIWATLDIRIEWDQAEAAIQYIINYSCPYIIPGEGEAKEAYYGQWITPQQFRCWLGMSGRDPTVHDPAIEATRPRPAQATRQQFLWRLRDISNDANISYLDADYKADLIRDGQLDRFQKMAYAIRYQPYTIREVKQLLDTGQITDAEIYGAFRDMGFADDKANKLKEMEKVIYARRHESEIVGATPATLARLYVIGQVMDNALHDRMKDLGYSKEDADRLILIATAEQKAKDATKYRTQALTALEANTKDAYMMGLITVQKAQDVLEELGALSQSAKAIVDAWNLEITIGYRKQVVASVKKGWESGFISVKAAVNALAANGLSAQRANETVAIWQLNLSYDQRMLNAGEVLRMVSEGTIDAEAATIRFHNMGFQPNEADLLIKEALARLAKATEVADARMEANKKRAIKDAESLKKQADAAAKQAVAALRAKMPQSVLNKALKEGLISEDDYRKRMKAMSYDDGEVDLLVKEILYLPPAKPTKEKPPVDPVAVAARKETPVSFLDRGLKTGLISVDAYTARLKVMGYSDGLISLKVDELCSTKGANCVQSDGPDDEDVADGQAAGTTGSGVSG